MKNRNVMLVTTTSTVEGWTIQSYLGTISSHIVAGTDMFTDLFASFSDFFGGRSQSYQKELSALHNEAVKQLQEKAFSMGANCILGLRIDHDEISGKGKQMFMVTAIGTAVKAVQIKSGQQEANITTDLVTQDDLVSLVKKRRIIRFANEGKLVLNNDTWNYVIQNQVHELADLVFTELEKRYENPYLEEPDHDFIKRSKEYFYSLPQGIAKEHLYAAMIRNSKLTSYATDLIGNMNLLDLGQVHNMLRSDRFEVRKGALQLLAFHKPYYDLNDIDAFENMLPIIKEGFPAKGERISEKGMLSSKVKEFWKCECGIKHEINMAHCYQCSRDIYGFKESEINPSKALSLISDRVAVLREQFIA